MDRKPVAMRERTVRLGCVGEYVMVRVLGDPQQTASGLIVPDAGDIAWGVVLSVGDKCKVKSEYGPALHVGQTIIFNRKAGVKLDSERKVISIDDIFAADEMHGIADTEPPAEQVQ